MNQSNVIAETQTVVVLVAEDFIGPDLQSSVLTFIPSNTGQVIVITLQVGDEV